MTRLIDLVRDDLNDLAGSHPVPPGLAERAVAAGYRRRRRRTALMGAAAVATVAAVVVPVTVRTLDDTVPAQGVPGLNVIFAKSTSVSSDKADRRQPRWQVLDPRTGRYREVAAGQVSEPSADLRYTVLLPPLLDADQARIGRYDTTTGKTRWYDAPAPSVDEPQISPDGRRAAYWVDKPEPGTAQIVVVDLGTGAVTPIQVPADVLPEAETAYVDDPSLGPNKIGRPRTTYVLHPPGDPVGWRLDDDRLTVGGAILDLSGNRIGTLPLPDKAVPVSILAGGAGALIRPEGQLGVYARTDVSGAIVGQVTLPICSHPDVPHDRTRGSMCTDAVMRFHSWRGTDQILVKEVGYGPNGEWINSLDAVDLDTGERRPVFRDDAVPGIGAMVVIPADGLSQKIQEKVAF